MTSTEMYLSMSLGTSVSLKKEEARGGWETFRPAVLLLIPCGLAGMTHGVTKPYIWFNALYLLLIREAKCLLSSVININEFRDPGQLSKTNFKLPC